METLARTRDLSDSRAGPRGSHRPAPSPAPGPSSPARVRFPLRGPCAGQGQALPGPQEQLCFSPFSPRHPPEISAKLSDRQNISGAVGCRAGTIGMAMARPGFCVRTCCATLSKSPPLSEPRFSEWEMKTRGYERPKQAPITGRSLKTVTELPFINHYFLQNSHWRSQKLDNLALGRH